MTKPPFADWAGFEIGKLRKIAEVANQEADALQTALDLYQGSKGSGAGSPASRTSETATTRSPRVSKYEPAFRAYEETGRLLSIDDMMEIAKRLGFSLDRANMRSQIFSQKSLGRVRPEGDRYVWGLLKQNPEPPVQEEAPDHS